MHASGRAAFCVPLPYAALMLALALAACGSDTQADNAEPAGSGGEAGSIGEASASIRYALEDPAGSGEYPFDVDSPGPPARIGAPVYVSAAQSSSGNAEPFSAAWSVIAPDGRSLPLVPSPASVEAAFTPSRFGEHTISLHVASTIDPAAVADAVLRLDVEAHLCDPSGTGRACERALPVSGETFSMGSPLGEGHSSEQPEHRATVADFALDRFEVTVGRFRRFLAASASSPPAAGAGADPDVAGSGWDSSWNGELPVSREQLLQAFDECGGTFTPEPASHEALPVNCVSWYEAFAFCVWDGGRLPTEAEWEHAASGGSEDRTYPWGESTPDPTRAVFNCGFDGIRACSEADIAPVGNAPAGKGRFGHDDLAGNVWEWVLDRYAPYSAEPCNGCAVTDAGEGRVFRGGDWGSDDASLLRAATRLGFLAEYRDATRGFRCARPLPR